MSTIRCECCAVEDVPACTFTVVFSWYNGAWLFSRHRDRATFETQGGHVEARESPEDAARRELYEEAGAVPASLTPVCGYFTDRDGLRSYGIVYLAIISRLEPLPAFEMAEVRAFAALPEALTYPQITPILYARVQAALKECIQ